MLWRNHKGYCRNPRERLGPVWTPLWAGGCGRTVGALLGLEDTVCGAVSSPPCEKKWNFCSHPAGSPHALPSSSWWSSSGSWWNYLSCGGAVDSVFTFFFFLQKSDKKYMYFTVQGGAWRSLPSGCRAVYGPHRWFCPLPESKKTSWLLGWGDCATVLGTASQSFPGGA